MDGRHDPQRTTASSAFRTTTAERESAWRVDENGVKYIRVRASAGSQTWTMAAATRSCPS